jgi:hypothetical protein
VIGPTHSVLFIYFLHQRTSQIIHHFNVVWNASFRCVHAAAHTIAHIDMRFDFSAADSGKINHCSNHRVHIRTPQTGIIRAKRVIGLINIHTARPYRHCHSVFMRTERILQPADG